METFADKSIGFDLHPAELRTAYFQVYTTKYRHENNVSRAPRYCKTACSRHALRNILDTYMAVSITLILVSDTYFQQRNNTIRAGRANFSDRFRVNQSQGIPLCFARCFCLTFCRHANAARALRNSATFISRCCSQGDLMVGERGLEPRTQ